MLFYCILIFLFKFCEKKIGYTILTANKQRIAKPAG